MLKKLVLCLLCFVINFHIVASVAAPSKISKLSAQETNKESKSDSEESSEEMTDAFVDLVLINHFSNHQTVFIPTEFKTDFHDYISHYQSPPKKVPLVPPSLV